MNESTDLDHSRQYHPRRFTPTTKQRFFRDRRRGYIDHLGGTASRAQLTLIDRVIRCEWDLLRLDARADEGDLSDHALRTKLALENRLRLDLVAIGLKGASARPLTGQEALAAIHAKYGHGDDDGN